jgi:hypothetical protein
MGQPRPAPGTFRIGLLLLSQVSLCLFGGYIPLLTKCPRSGLSTANFRGCSVEYRDCISTSAIAVYDRFRSEFYERQDIVLRVKPVQIRWAESDISKLSSHPMSPTQTLATRGMRRDTGVHLSRRSGIVLHGIPRPGSRSRVELGVSFVPLLLCSICSVVYQLIHYRKSKRLDTTRPFVPVGIRWTFLLHLLGLTLTFILLINVAIRTFPLIVSQSIEEILSRRDLESSETRTAEDGLPTVNSVAMSTNTSASVVTDNQTRCNTSFSTLVLTTE